MTQSLQGLLGTNADTCMGRAEIKASASTRVAGMADLLAALMHAVHGRMSTAWIE